MDGSVSAEEETERIVKEAEAAPNGIVILSKSDLPTAEVKLDTSLPVVPVSVISGEGLSELEKQIQSCFPVSQVPAGEILTNARQADAVKRALESMQAAETALAEGRTPDIVLTETETAMQALGEITGTSIREDITNRIFSRFCVGK